MNEKNITLLNLDFKNDKILVCVNNEIAIISSDDRVDVNRAKIKLKDIIGEDYAKLEIEIDKCKEDSCRCGIDCRNFRCITQPTPQNECSADLDCDDGNDQTLDKCEGTPKKCEYSLIEIPECATDIDCDDANMCTEDKCTNNECIHNPIDCNQTAPDDVTGRVAGQPGFDFKKPIFIVFIALIVLIILLGILFGIKKKI